MSTDEPSQIRTEVPQSARTRGFIRAVLLACLVVLAIGLPIAIWWAWRDNSYEACMLSEMKGQSQSMYSMVDKLCSPRFKREVPILITEIEYEWGHSPLGASAEIRIKKSGEYNVTRTTVRFAPKPCNEVKKEDWSGFKDALFQENVAIVPLDPEETALPMGQSCMNSDGFFGTYK